MKELIDRLEKAAGPDRVLGNDILFACGWTQNEYGLGPSRSIEWVNPDPNGIDYLDGDQPDPTASIDAALALVPDGWGYSVSNRAPEPHAGRAWVHNKKLVASRSYEGAEYTAATPAIAICMACLEAIATLSAAQETK